ncbi:hypothetical protein OAX78_04690, partial [Planctomycetota bacterium]|nr:hypothetical protein [Planctomycetota bacterium]
MSERSERTNILQDLIQGPKAVILLSPMLIVWVVWGVRLGATPVHQADLFWAFTFASLMGGGGVAALCMRKRGLPSRLGYAALLLLVWRLGYFPILVFSGVATSGVEWLFFGKGAGLSALYVVFVIWVWLFHMAVAFVLHLATRPKPAEPPTGAWRLLDRRLLLAAVVPNVLVAMAVSVIEPSEDLTV